MPYKDPTSPAAIESSKRAVRKYEESHWEERRKQKKERYWNDPEKERQRNRLLKLKWKESGLCVNCGGPRYRADRTLCLICAHKMAVANNAYQIRLKRKVFERYGGARCSCCGIDILEFLSIDHIEKNGTSHRKEIGGGGMKMYLWLQRHNYPEGYRVLCHNCNQAMGAYGYCPHERERCLAH